MAIRSLRRCFGCQCTLGVMAVFVTLIVWNRNIPHHNNELFTTASLSRPTVVSRTGGYEAALPCIKGWHTMKNTTITPSFTEDNPFHGVQPLLVLFTSLKNVAHRNVTHSNTIINWAQYGPEVVPVLFNDNTDPYILKLANEYGWNILPLHTKQKNEAPQVKYMFREAWKAYPNSLFVGFSNGDILFDNGLLRTVRYLRDLLPILNRTLVIGARYNVKLQDRRVTTHRQIRALITKERQTPVSAYAQDYFLIARNHFPWHKFPDKLVIGRAAYDNFLVALARQDNMSVVDASCTIGALHQMGPEGTWAGYMNKDRDFNKQIIKKFDYSAGSTRRVDYFTQPSENGAHILLKKHT